MLVLSRKKKQSIKIGTDVEITIIDITEDQVRLGINAPKSVTVHRKEIYDKLVSEMKEAKINKDKNPLDKDNLF